MEEFHV
jgi:hypothetical protein